MKFRRVLISAVRLFQCSGLCPVSVYEYDPALRKSSGKWLAVLTATICALNVCLWVYVTMHFVYLVDERKPKIFTFIAWVVSSTIRAHTIAVLIESYTNRAMQLKLLEKLDEIEDIFVYKLHVKSDDVWLRGRCHRFIVVWLLKLALVVFVAFFAAVAVLNLDSLVRLAIMVMPLYTSTLFYAQLAVYLHMVEYNTGKINNCLRRLRDIPRIFWHGHQRHALLTVEMHDVCEQLIHLRICYCKTWQASVLINRCVRWSFLIGVTNDFVLYVANLYWILFSLVQPSFENWLGLGIYVSWISVLMTHFLVITGACDQILEKVRACAAVVQTAN